MQDTKSSVYPWQASTVNVYGKTFRSDYKVIRSQLKARRILKEFHPQVAVGVGGYASGPTLK